MTSNDGDKEYLFISFISTTSSADDDDEDEDDDDDDDDGDKEYRCTGLTFEYWR